jgi:hypothetical protein
MVAFSRKLLNLLRALPTTAITVQGGRYPPHLQQPVGR